MTRSAPGGVHRPGDTEAPAWETRLARTAQSLSRRVAAVEKVVVAVLVAAIFALILVNVVTRAAGRPLVWVDELAIYVMVAACFIGTSLSVRQRLDFAMTLVLDRLDTRQRAWCTRVITFVGLLYAFFILWCCWRMFDPMGLWQNDFDIARFAESTSNFLYSEPTQTLGIPKWIVYLVMPLYGLGLTIHSTANMLEDLGWAGADGTGDDIVLEAG